MKIVIIGHNGQLGTDCVTLLKTQHELITPTLAELDLCDEEGTMTFLRNQGADVLINCAAYTAVDKCETERELASRINGKGPGYLAKSCKKTGTRLIHVSTDYVFDGTKEVPESYRETDPVNPRSEYGRSKLEGEHLVQLHSDNYVILRTAWLYSGNGPNFLKTMLRITLADPTATRKVVNDQYGSLTWSFTLARQIEKLLPSDVQGIVHTTSEGYSTWYEAACYFLEQLGIAHKLIPCSTAEYPTPAVRPKNSILENKVLKEHGLNLFHDWKEDVDLFIAQYGAKMLAELTNP